MVSKHQVQDALTLLEGVDTATPAALREAVLAVRGRLQLIGTEKIEDVLAGVIGSLPSLAQELGKPAPAVTFATHGIVLKAQIFSVVQNVFMHLYRNAMDHGLEAAAERLAKGKPQQGTIALEVTLDGGQVHFKLRDDGKGLAVASILRKAQAQGLVAQATDLQPHDLAQLVFAPGFSTAEQVTEVSGRGVGMDAVKGFVEQEGGTIALRLAPLNEDTAGVDMAGANAGYRSFETVISLPERFVLQS